MSSRPDSFFEIHQLWQSGLGRMCSNCCCSCSFEPEIIKIGQSSHKTYSNKILNFQESITILNVCTKTVWKLIKDPSYSLFLFSVTWHVSTNQRSAVYKTVITFSSYAEKMIYDLQHVSNGFRYLLFSLRSIGLIGCWNGVSAIMLMAWSQGAFPPAVLPAKQN